MLKITKNFSQEDVAKLIRKAIIDELKEKGHSDLVKNEEQIIIDFLPYYECTVYNEQEETAIVTTTINL